MAVGLSREAVAGGRAAAAADMLTAAAPHSSAAPSPAALCSPAVACLLVVLADVRLVVHPHRHAHVGRCAQRAVRARPLLRACGRLQGREGRRRRSSAGCAHSIRGAHAAGGRAGHHAHKQQALRGAAEHRPRQRSLSPCTHQWCAPFGSPLDSPCTRSCLDRLHPLHWWARPPPAPAPAPAAPCVSWKGGREAVDSGVSEQSPHATRCTQPSEPNRRAHSLTGSRGRAPSPGRWSAARRSASAAPGCWTRTQTPRRGRRAWW